MAGDKPSSDPLRYVSDTRPTSAAVSKELGYLKLRYKLPGQKDSHLMQTPITTDAAPILAAAPEATRWAIAVAGFGEKLRGSPWVGKDFGWDQLEALAQGARGKDEFGLRADFTRLVRDAKDAKSVNE